MSVDRAERIRELYQGFNDRDLDAFIATMAPDVDWPNGWHGEGRAEVEPLSLPVRAYGFAPDQPSTVPAVGPVDVRCHRGDDRIEVPVVEPLVELADALGAVDAHGTSPRACPVSSARAGDAGSAASR